MNMNKPAILTSHDLLKTFAVIIMVIDHIGYYFYPEDMWWRAVGRIGFPIWFYLIGHASNRDFSPRLVGGALILMAMDIVTGMPVFPLNALVTIMILRLVLDRVMVPVARDFRMVWPMTALFALLFLPTNAIVEYGTLALMFAMLGYMVKNQETLGFRKEGVQNFMLVISLLFVVLQCFVFGFDAAQMIFMAAGTMGVCLVLLYFKAREFPVLDTKIPFYIKWFARFCGRRTLEIYVAHLVLFKIAALAMGRDGMGLFSFKFFV